MVCINSPIGVTVSGSAEALQEEEDLIHSRAFSRRLVVKAAYHTKKECLFIEELVEPYLNSLMPLKEEQGEPRGTVKMFSSVTGAETSD